MIRFWDSKLTGAPPLLSLVVRRQRGFLMKVKLFWKNAPVVHGDKNARAFEDEINAWLSEHPRITIIDIRQSSSGETFGSWFVSVWYEDGGAEQAAAPDRGGR